MADDWDEFWKDAEIIDAYTDEQAVEDGVIIPVSFGIINRVTRTVFDDFVKDEECDLVKFNLFMDKALREFHMLRQRRKDWFYKIVIDERPYFICQNSSSLFTLMKPEDY